MPLKLFELFPCIFPSKVPILVPYPPNDRFLDWIVCTCTKDSNPSRKSSSTNTGHTFECIDINIHFVSTASTVSPDLPQCFISLLLDTIDSCCENVYECDSHTAELLKLA